MQTSIYSSVGDSAPEATSQDYDRGIECVSLLPEPKRGGHWGKRDESEAQVPFHSQQLSPAKTNSDSVGKDKRLVPSIKI